MSQGACGDQEFELTWEGGSRQRGSTPMAKGHDPGRRVHLGSGTRQAAHHHPRGEPGWGRRSSSIRAKTDPEEREPAPPPRDTPSGTPGWWPPL